MASPSYRMMPALAAFVAASLAGGGVHDWMNQPAAGTAHAQSDVAHRTLRLAPGDIVRATLDR